ncbi:SCO family protein [Virgibacillus oceani]|uniref:SCO1 protein n=1 Tax=Virgibacillus oceani TaxID=1479511 RepID=A0A917H7U1_9BACI|nr:SCO family protein [Virgibacillus oceani]GGG70357.1 SCO1 protein [Virgibacillus oceani]
MKCKSKFALLFIVMIIVLSACGDKYEGDISYEVKDFSFTNQNGETVSKSELDGKFWIADFIYTSCTTECPPMTYNMQKLQQQLKEAGLHDVQLMSFSVDPEIDKPAKLKDYGESRGIDFSNWNFLTGYDMDTIKEFSIKSFKTPLEKTDEGDFMHGINFFLVSPEGNAIEQYNGMERENMKKIIEDIQNLKQQAEGA